jgi:hypothetical protein
VRGLIWLGTLPNLPDESRLVTTLQKYDPRYSNGDESQNVCTESELERIFPAVSMLLNQPWFTRAWVFQESVLAKTSIIISSSLDMSLDTLATLVRDMWFLPKPQWSQETPGIAFLRQAIRLRKKAVNGERASISLNEFYWYLNLMALSTASDPRDHVYAFIGLLQDSCEEPVSIYPAYEKPISDVFTGTAETLVQSTGCLDLFGLLPSENYSFGNRRLPSWVPDWSQRKNWNLCLGPVDFLSLNSANGFSLYQQNTTPEQIQVQGKIIDTIVHVNQTTPYRADGVHRHLLIEEQRNELVHSGLATDAEMTRDRVLRAYFGRGPPDLEESRTTFEKAQSQQNNFLVPSSKRLAFGDKKKLALLHQSARSGDQISILHGSRVPVVIRRQTEGNYLVIGQCYYEGAMLGEAVNWERDNADTFTLL